jgi:dTDP-4-dehydrorhamnose reductase
VLDTSACNSVIRLITLFGLDYWRPNFLTRVLIDLQKNKQIYGIVDQIQNPLYVDIAAEAVSFIHNKQLTGIYHLGSLDWDTNYNFVVRFANTFGFDGSLVKKISFEDFTKKKKGHRSKKSVLIPNKFAIVSNHNILQTVDDSFKMIYKMNNK